MQNRYTGDIGDYSKLGLLRTLQAAGFTIGLNWYLTPDETHNGDGRHVNYLYQDEYRACDPDLWTALGSLVRLDNREVRYMESDDIVLLGLPRFQEEEEGEKDRASDRVVRKVT